MLMVLISMLVKDPVSITINESKQKDITLAHEFGHFIDHQLNKNSFGVYASEYSDLFADWRNAVESTKSMKTLRDMRANPDKYIKDSNMDMSLDLLLKKQITF